MTGNQPGREGENLAAGPLPPASQIRPDSETGPDSQIRPVSQIQMVTPLAEGDQEGGDPVCWAYLVCEECGAVTTEGHRAGCSRSG